LFFENNTTVIPLKFQMENIYENPFCI